MTSTIYQWASMSASERDAVLSRPEGAQSAELVRTAADIIAKVREGGDAAIAELTATLDGVEIEELEVSDAEKVAARNDLRDSEVQAIDVAITNIRTFHEAQLPKNLKVETVPGVVCERRYHPIDSVGLYVPAGSAPLPSAAMMLAVPAVIAQCPTRILCTPPNSDGAADPGVVVAATSAGIDRIFKVGGAQAIAAMAYGTESVPSVRKIFGPGNAYVTAAKSLVSGDSRGAAIDMPAGPSEVLVIADQTANAAFVAADLLSQAEHGPDSQVLLVTSSPDLAVLVQREINKQLASLARSGIAAQALANSRIIVVDSIAMAIEISNRYAPEHLILQTEHARALLPEIRNAGSVFLGKWAPESVGDYCSGTNHVLPTYGHAATYSGLGVEQFCRSMTVQELTADGLGRLADTVTTLAELEGLDGHSMAVRKRLELQR